MYLIKLIASSAYIWNHIDICYTLPHSLLVICVIRKKKLHNTGPISNNSGSKKLMNPWCWRTKHLLCSFNKSCYQLLLNILLWFHLSRWLAILSHWISSTTYEFPIALRGISFEWFIIYQNERKLVTFHSKIH